MANLKLRSMAYEDFMRIPVEERDYQTIYSLSNGDLWIMNRNVGNDVLMVDALPEEPVEGTLYIRKSDHKGFYWTGEEWQLISGDAERLVAGKGIKIEGNVISSLLDVSIGKDITTNITVGALEEGTEIPAATTLADILERILVAPPVTTVKLYYGVTDGIPTDITGLTEVEVGRDELAEGYGILYKTEDQRVVFAYPKELGLLSKILDSTKFFNLLDGFNCVDDGEHFVYFEQDTTYDPEEGATYYFYWG